MNTQYLVLIAGHNASGKTKLAKIIVSKFGFNSVNGDDIRDFLIAHVGYYHKAHYSYPNAKIKSANQVVTVFRKALIKELLARGESVIVDGGGIVRKSRKTYLALKRVAAHRLITIIIETNISETVLLARLMRRDAINARHRWVKFYNDIKKPKYQAVTSDEADYVLRYNQKNTPEILRQLKAIVKLKNKFRPARSKSHP